MRKPNRKCVICGHEYFYCTSGCQDSLGKPSWMTSFCCENCKQIYEVVARYNFDKTTAQDARRILDNCDLSEKENFTSSTQRLIAEIYDVTDIQEVDELVDATDVLVCEPLEVVDVNEANIDASLAVSTTAAPAINTADAMVNSTVASVATMYNGQNNYKKKKKKKKKVMDSDFV